MIATFIVTVYHWVFILHLIFMYILISSTEMCPEKYGIITVASFFFFFEICLISGANKHATLLPSNTGLFWPALTCVLLYFLQLCYYLSYYDNHMLTFCFIFFLNLRKTFFLKILMVIIGCYEDVIRFK